MEIRLAIISKENDMLRAHAPDALLTVQNQPGEAVGSSSGNCSMRLRKSASSVAKWFETGGRIEEKS